MPNSPFQTDFAENIYQTKYMHPDDGGWSGTAERVTNSVFDAIEADADTRARVYDLILRRKFMPGGRYLYAAGRELHQVQNCLLLRAGDSREGWAQLQHNATMALMTGAGIGVWYGDIRPSGELVLKTGGVASGPLPLMNMTNETGRNVMQGGARRSAIWAGLPWSHPDIHKFIRAKDWPEWLREQKALDFNTPAPLDSTNISVTLDGAFFDAISDPRNHMHAWAVEVYEKVVDKMVTTGEPGFTIDHGKHEGQVLRNACTEITSADDSDICNLGTLVLSRFDSPAEFGRAVRDGVRFLTAGTEYSHVPYEKVAEIREKNRRLGLGLMGVHEFLMLRGCRYGSDEGFEVLEPYLEEFARALEHSWDYQDALGLSRSVAATAIAPNGTIGIVAETTPSGEPIFSAAERRRVRSASPSGDVWQETMVVDPVAKRMAERGVNVSLIEDAHTLSFDVERRFAMQAFLQSYTDHAISSTVNLPGPITSPTKQKEFRALLFNYLPSLRGITCYPDGARDGQPKTPVGLDKALASEGIILEQKEDTCVGGVCSV